MSKPKGNVLMLLANNPFPQDRRVYQEAICLQRNGWQVSVLANRNADQLKFEVIDNVEVSRFGSPGFLNVLPDYILEQLVAPFIMLFKSIKIYRKHKFQVLHAHNPPDTLFLVAWFYKAFGVRFIFDHHDLCPELYLSRFGPKAKTLLYRLLQFFERRSYLAADVVIATNESYRDLAVERGDMKIEQVFVVRNGPDLERLEPLSSEPKDLHDNKTRLFYIGEMNPQDGVDYLLRSLGYLKFEFKRDDFYCVLVGKGDSVEELKQLALSLKIKDNVKFTGWVAEEDMLRYFSEADICVDPDPSSPLNDKSTWIKIMEYMAMSKPIVAFRLKETVYSAQDAALYAEPNDEKQFAEKILELMDNPELRRELGQKGRYRVEQELAWELVSKNLLKAYERVMR
jgi:glycosyltransferase involved in cell wall biosynthesis